jgi:hypothetical protein
MDPIWAALVLNMGFKWEAQILLLWVDFEFWGRLFSITSIIILLDVKIAPLSTGHDSCICIKY